jgi:hypothetical protein
MALSTTKSFLVAGAFLLFLCVGAYVWHRFRARLSTALSFWFSSRGGVPHSERAELAELTRELSALNAEIERLTREPPLEADLSQTVFAAPGEVVADDDDSLGVHNFIAEPSLWDRVEFLSRCGLCVTLMSRILDEQLCDHFDGPRSGYRLARALRALLLRAQACAGAEPDARAAAASFCDSGRWTSLARERVVRPWLAALSQGAEPLCTADAVASLSAPPVVAALEELAALHAQLSAWPAVTDASLMWALAEASSEPTAVDFGAGGADEAFTPFSPTGRVLRAGDAVFIAGPTLLGRGSSAGGVLSGAQLAELRGKRCLTLVVDAGGA